MAESDNTDVPNEQHSCDCSLYEAIKQFILRRVHRLQMAEDLVQETFLRLQAEIPPVPEERRRSWLYRVARNLVIDSFRHQKCTDRMLEQFVQLQPDGQTSDPHATLEKNEEMQMVIDSINQLDELHREVVRLKFQEGLTYDEIAETIDRPRTTVAWLLHQAIQDIRKKLNHQAINGENGKNR